jgi:Ni/Co efflux regulator RcnB
MKKLLMTTLAAAAFVTPMMASKSAEAGRDCRDFTNNSYIHGRHVSGYGTACRENGAWVIMSSYGDIDPFYLLRARGETIIAQGGPVYFQYGSRPHYAPVTYYAPAPRYYYAPPPNAYYFGYRDRDWDRHHHRGRGNDRHDRGRDRHHDHDDHRGNHGGRGHR